MNKLSCGIVWDLLPLYCDGACGEESVSAVEEHLAECEQCRKRYAEMKTKLPEVQPEELETGVEVEKFGEFLKRREYNARRKGLNIGFLIALGIVVVAFYLLPLLIQDTGSGIVILLLVIPVLCMAGGFSCGVFSGFQWAYPLLTAALFLPTVLLYFNDTALIYVVIYGGIALLGDGLGGLLHHYFRKRKRGS